MVIVARTPEVDRTCGGSFRKMLSEFAIQLSGDDGARNVAVTSVCPRDMCDADVFVLVAHVDASGLESTARQALTAWSQSKFLAGKVAFCVLVGDRPADFGRQYDIVADALSHSGATAFAPAIALVRGQSDHQLMIAEYCRHWAPVMPALRQIAAASAKRTVAA